MQHIEKVMGLDELGAVKLIRGAYTREGLRQDRAQDSWAGEKRH